LSHFNTVKGSKETKQADRRKKRYRKRKERMAGRDDTHTEDRKQTTEKKNIEGKEYEKEKTKGGEGRE
jgi:hypothetical protein